MAVVANFFIKFLFKNNGMGVFYLIEIKDEYIKMEMYFPKMKIL
ncbi:hypothetical protein X874_15170 [Mannheimia varigena USDA-ARS-USMARC-1312]|nr:hypothetical protein X874_15170 [Mannheimia varigena USDA-ARS-USMARC-1312]